MKLPPGKYIKYLFRSLVYPGLDLHTYNRVQLCKYWKKGPRDVLDAGSGNGFFSWLAYRDGARVTGLNINRDQFNKARDYFINYKKLDPARIRFELASLYDLEKETRSFDEIICYETLEHIKRDDFVIRQFYRILRPGGYLHLCCPNAAHPRHQAEILDLDEKGGHVRPGYSTEDYQRMLSKAGFRIDMIRGIGGVRVYKADLFLRRLRNNIGDIASLPLFFFLLPLSYIDSGEPEIPFSLYARAIKTG